MKPRYVLLTMAALCVGLMSGYQIGWNTKAQTDAREFRRLIKHLERFENSEVFHHAEYVAKVSGAPLYQILTGKVDQP
jgi:hypothetical protein